MKVSSLVKLFGIAAAGFVPQAQANPFGISFVKVDPPKDKKEEAICFRLKLSQTDVFSEHNFTDITFRPDTTVFLQKNMVIGDEEESLKKPFKNFNAEKDPFEIPEKYLPLEDKDRAEWVDKDGKPLKFLVVLGRGCSVIPVATLTISDNPKQPAFYADGDIVFLGSVDCVRIGYAGEAAYYLNMLGARGGITPKHNIGCLLTENALGGLWKNPDEYKGVRVLFHTDGNFFQAVHVPSKNYFEGRIDSTKVKSSFFICSQRSLCSCGCTSIIDGSDCDCIFLVLMWSSSQENAKYSKVKTILNDGERCDVNIVKKGEQIISVNSFYDVKSLRVLTSFDGTESEFGKLRSEGKIEGDEKLSLCACCFVFIFPKAQPNK